MKIIDHSPFLSDKGEITFIGRIQGPMKFGPSWIKDMQAQKDVIEIFSKVLDKFYVLLRNVDLLGSGVPIPLILVGPQGIMVFYISSLRGVYRAKNEDWTSMIGGKFRQVKPNLIARSKLMAAAVEIFLSKQGIKSSHVEPILVFPNPGMHVDMITPAVRIVPGDALDRFLANLVIAPGVLDGATVSKIVNIIAETKDAPEEIREVEDVLVNINEQDMAAKKDSGKLDQGDRGGGPQKMTQKGKPRFSRNQLIALGTLVVMSVLLLSCVLLFILFFYR